MKHLGISGGGTKITGLFGAAEVIMNDVNYRPDIISGVSAGAILALPLALGKFTAIRQELLNMRAKDVFGTPPLTNKGKIKPFNALKKILEGKPYLTNMKPLKRLLKSIVSEIEFNAWVANEDAPIVIVGMVDASDGRRVYPNLKNMNYEDALTMIVASSSMPVFTEPIHYHKSITSLEVDGDISLDPPFMLYDGGLRDHCPTAKVLLAFKNVITETISIYSRPKNYRAIHKSGVENLLKATERSFEIMNVEVSKSDESEEKHICSFYNINLKGIVYLPRVMKSVYDFDEDRIKILYQAGRNAAWDTFMKPNKNLIT